jgi:hypothetical protein
VQINCSHSGFCGFEKQHGGFVIKHNPATLYITLPVEISIIED